MLQERNWPGLQAVSPRPLTELLSCPQMIEQKLGAATQRRSFVNGETVFEQGTPTKGLYLLVTGEYQRTADRKEKRLILNPLHAGALVELSAVLGDGHHTYSLTAASDGSAIIFPQEVLTQAFCDYPPLRMHLLEELGREVSRAYTTLCLNRGLKTRRPRKVH